MTFRKIEDTLNYGRALEKKETNKHGMDEEHGSLVLLYSRHIEGYGRFAWSFLQALIYESAHQES